MHSNHPRPRRALTHLDKVLWEAGSWTEGVGRVVEDVRSAAVEERSAVVDEVDQKPEICRGGIVLGVQSDPHQAFLRVSLRSFQVAL